MTSIFYKIQWGKNQCIVYRKLSIVLGNSKISICVLGVTDYIFPKNGYGNSSNLATPCQEADFHSPFELQQDFVQQIKCGRKETELRASVRS